MAAPMHRDKAREKFVMAADSLFADILASTSTFVHENSGRFLREVPVVLLRFIAMT